MSTLQIPQGYRPSLNLYETQAAIECIKAAFAARLSAALNLRRVTAPLFVRADTGLNDDLNGVERAVAFDIPDAAAQAQVVHSLAKWKRMALGAYGFPVGEGLYTDMNAIRRDETLSNIHSVYVDQWDWCRVIRPEERNLDFLKATVRKIAGAVDGTLKTLRESFPQVTARFCPEVTFVTAQELEDLYPALTPKERENAYTELHKTVFIIGIGGLLRSGQRHDGRAPDYDDWSLNGDLLCWDETLGMALELSSMGIRVDSAALKAQLTAAGCPERRELPFHRALLAGELPLTMGGGIGQSRLCMFLLGKAHIGEVQASVWDEATLRACRQAGIPLL